jgi:hypothetical protein
MKKKTCIAVFPVYRKLPSAEELFNLKTSVSNLGSADLALVAPKSLELAFYKNELLIDRIETFDDKYFQSVSSYSTLLLTEQFYQRFHTHDFTLIVQADAIVLTNEIELWTNLSYDYIGAPWPKGWQMSICIPELATDQLFSPSSFVGNGGLSLRRNTAILNLLSEFHLSKEMWTQNGWPEDLFFALLGQYSNYFRLPNLATAAAFSIETQPELMMTLNRNRLPFGLHAWRLYGFNYWAARCFPSLSSSKGRVRFDNELSNKMVRPA